MTRCAERSGEGVTSRTDAVTRARWQSVAERALFVVAGLVIATSMGLVLTFDYGRDQAIYAVVAREVLAGGAPYRAAFDFKPPGIFSPFAAARMLFGPTEL